MTPATPVCPDEEPTAEDLTPPPCLVENPITGKWEPLTARQWFILRAGLPLTTKLSDLEIAHKASWKIFVVHVLKTNYEDETLLTLQKLSKQGHWLGFTTTAEKCAEWLRFMASCYNLRDFYRNQVQPMMQMKEALNAFRQFKAARAEAASIRAAKAKNRYARARLGRKSR